ncbi:MAG TPA: ABC transporter ATP-binding protein [Thermomicrobiaceae bacterium]|nr:ABC transporter ATP-binding protein [Thermomicrobiaceae bacterium]
MDAIEAEGLRRTFRSGARLLGGGREIVAVERVDLAVARGTVFGLLGPNGAGKTTTIKMLSTLLIPSGGRAAVAGFDVVRQEREVRRRLGVVLGGDRGLYGKLSARDNLLYFGRLYGLPGPAIARRADDLLALVGLVERAGDRVEGFSRGMKQRLHLARALLHDPPVVFLDEPTIGLDPAAAVNLRRIVQSLVPAHTVLLTTHYLAEADELCDRIAIVDHGRVLVEDTPEGIKRRVAGRQRYLLRVHGPGEGRDGSGLAAALAGVPAVDGVVADLEADGTTALTLTCRDEAPVIDAAVRLLQGQGARIASIQAVEPTLEDAFLALTNGAAA